MEKFRKEEKMFDKILKKDTETLLSLLKEVQIKQDYTEIAKCYLQLGTAYKKEGRMRKALYYLNRFDNLVGGDNSLYEKFQEDNDKVMHQITDLEMELESEPYAQEIQEQVVAKAETLDISQKMQWMLLTMSRFCTLFQRISTLDGFEEFGRLDEMITYFSKGFYEELDEEEEWELSEYWDKIDEVFDSLRMSDYTKKVDMPNQESFVPADLESGEGTYFFTMAYDALQSFLLEELDEDDIEMEFVTCGILSDYYYRTCDIEDEKDVKEERKVQEEVERIFSDYAFIQEKPDKEQFQERVEQYKKIMLI